jgi:peptidoglycan LD-endopeptidase LytH
MIAALVLSFWITALPPDPIAEWGRFILSVRDQTVPKEEAKKQFPILYRALKDLCRAYPFKPFATWAFPLQGHGIRDVGSGGFRPDIRYGSSPVKGYDFYDGDRHGGHPAYDIFIRDRNQDALDDANQKPVNVLAPVDLLILSAARDWMPGSEIRGGRYIWALDPLHDQIFYFAHLNEIYARAGEYIKAGTAIGTAGRTGKNAFPARSPTHLHMMVLAVNGSALLPFDYIRMIRIRIIPGRPGL